MCKCNSKREIREHVYNFYNSSYIKKPMAYEKVRIRV